MRKNLAGRRGRHGYRETFSLFSVLNRKGNFESVIPARNMRREMG